MLLLKVYIYISSIRVGSLIRGLRFRNLHPGWNLREIHHFPEKNSLKSKHAICETFWAKTGLFLLFLYFFHFFVFFLCLSYVSYFLLFFLSFSYVLLFSFILWHLIFYLLFSNFLLFVFIIIYFLAPLIRCPLIRLPILIEEHTSSIPVSLPFVFGRTNKNRLDIHISIEKVFELPETSTEVRPLFQTPPHQVSFRNNS